MRDTWETLIDKANDASAARERKLMAMPRADFDALQAQVIEACKQISGTKKVFTYKGTRLIMLSSQMEMVAFRLDGGTLDEYKKACKDRGDAVRNGEPGASLETPVQYRKSKSIEPVSIETMRELNKIIAPRRAKGLTEADYELIAKTLGTTVDEAKEAELIVARIRRPN